MYHLFDNLNGWALLRVLDYLGIAILIAGSIVPMAQYGLLIT